MLNTLEAGDSILDVVGPLGRATEIERYGTVVVVGGGVGTAIAYPTAKALHEAGNRVICIIGARTKDLVIFEDEMRVFSDPLIVTTDDGSYGMKAVVTLPLKELIDSAADRPDYILAIGPIPMMRAVAETSRESGIKTVVSLNAIMVDGTGMCGGCRVSIDGKSQFACVDGPEFDAHKVDFALLSQRGAMYRDKERIALDRFDQEHECRLLQAAEV
jgi:ferredoxin--NADP+ reductase